MTQQITVSRGKRVLIGLAWGLGQLVILGVLFFCGLLAGGLLGVYVFGSQDVSGLVDLGFVAGIVAAIAVNHSARIWLQRLRLRGLRRRGTAVDATVVSLNGHYTSNPRGGPGNTYCTVLVGWTDPVTGASWKGERLYRFWGSAPRGFRAACADGAKVGVYYPPGRPSRFVIDIPFAPTMADLV